MVEQEKTIKRLASDALAKQEHVSAAPSGLRILFIGAGQGWHAFDAACSLRAQAPETQILSAGLQPIAAPPEILRNTLGDNKFVNKNNHLNLKKYSHLHFDVVITLDPQAQRAYAAESQGEELAPDADGPDPTRPLHSPSAAPAAAQRPLHAGLPMHLDWSLYAQEPQWERLKSASRETQQWLQTRQDLAQRVHGLTAYGYLNALRTERQRLGTVLDAIDDAVVVHDAQRRVYLFNRAAERITGFTRDQVVGHDCHEVFGSQGICGGQCTFRHGPDDNEGRQEKSVLFCDREGVNRHLRMVVDTLEREPGQARRVVATFRDVSEVVDLRRELSGHLGFGQMIGGSAPMREVFERIRQVAGSDYPALISGESGVGKELAARAVHDESRRKGGPFVPINCGALPTHILESELFGHVRGAFTGAVRDHKGRFELADGGTLFLDEVGELEPAFQVKLLRVLQEKRFERVGGEKAISVDVRIISATNRDLRQQVALGQFREDLYYRLAVVPIHIPPLRERREDIPFLIDKIIADIRHESGTKVGAPSDDAMTVLLRYPWPGNVRELINALRFASVRCEGAAIALRHLPPELQQTPLLVTPTTSAGFAQPIAEAATAPVAAPGFDASAANVGAPAAGDDASAHLRALLQPRRTLSAVQIAQAINEVGGNKVLAAKKLGISRATLYRRLNALLEES